MIKYYLFFFIVLGQFVSGQSAKSVNLFQGTQIKHIIPYRNEIWFGTYGKGLIIYDKLTEKWRTINSNNSSLKNDLIECFAVDQDYIWVGSTDGLWICDRKTNSWTQRKFSAGGIYGLWIRSLFYDSLNSRLFVGRFTNLSVFDKLTGKWQDFDLTIGNDKQTSNIKTLFVDSRSYLWVGTEAGVHLMDARAPEKKSLMFFNANTEGFANNSKYVSPSVIKEIGNEIYIGLSEFVTPDNPNYNSGGLLKRNSRNNKWSLIDKRTGLISNGIYSVEQMGNFVIVSTYEFIPTSKAEKGMGISLINRATGKIINLKIKNSGIAHERIFSVYFDGKNIWLGTFSGISRIQMNNSFLN